MVIFILSENAGDRIVFIRDRRKIFFCPEYSGQFFCFIIWTKNNIINSKRDNIRRNRLKKSGICLDVQVFKE